MILTLGYVAILVIALALSLIAIWYRLLKVNRVLAEVDEALREVRSRSARLDELLRPLDEATAAAADEVIGAHASVENAQGTAAERFEETAGTAVVLGDR